MEYIDGIAVLSTGDLAIKFAEERIDGFLESIALAYFDGEKHFRELESSLSRDFQKDLCTLRKEKCKALNKLFCLEADEDGLKAEEEEINAFFDSEEGDCLYYYFSLLEDNREKYAKLRDRLRRAVKRVIAILDRHDEFGDCRKKAQTLLNGLA